MAEQDGFSTSQNISYAYALDHVRFTAAILVFSFHVFHGYFGSFAPHPNLAYLALIIEGHTGVALFFVLSGFLFCGLIDQPAEKRISYWAFMKNRALRIFPLFVFVFFIAISLGRNQFEPQNILYLLFSNLGRHQHPTLL